MKQKHILKEDLRFSLLDELYKRYGEKPSLWQRLKYYRKKLMWLFFIVGAKMIKKTFDVLFSIFLIVFLSPLLVIVALLIKMTDGGPILYISKRVGKWGKEFNFPKFRSMHMGSDKEKEQLKNHQEDKSDKRFKMKNDPRITWIGRIIRKASIDELPQLWCIIKGDMSLVGPRPPLPEEVAKYTMEERKRLDVLPGLTCIWQVSGRSDVSFNKQVELDLQYIESQSVWGDFIILLKTIPAVLSGRGAY